MRATQVLTLAATIVAAVGTPVRAYAATFKDIVDGSIVPLGNQVIIIVYGLVFVFFLFGMMKFFFAQGEEGREKGKQHMLWGIIILVVLFGIWGILKILLGVLTDWSRGA